MSDCFITPFPFSILNACHVYKVIVKMIFLVLNFLKKKKKRKKNERYGFRIRATEACNGGGEKEVIKPIALIC